MIHRSFSIALMLVCSLVGHLPADEFPKPYNTEAGEPMSAEKAAAEWRVPPGFKVNVFAAEPDVCNPIGMSWDGRGRLWIAENYTYAERPKKMEYALRDRIIVLADEDGDGRAEKRTVFADDVQALTSLEWDPQGVWAICLPQLVFIPDRNHDDKPDGPAEVHLDGFRIPPENFHNFANGLRWGPDGWLYGRCGASAPGEVGAPGTPDDQRIPVRGGMWRYHPTRRVFETLCHGTTNPWGHDWNPFGECFFVNTVNGHLWHMIPGAHFVRPHTIDPNQRVYESIDMHADHWHWDTSKTWMDSRTATGEHDRLGGGHAHIGAMIYLGDQWPKEYYGRLLTLNQHGRRANVERLERHGSGYVAKHETDMLFAADPWFRGIDLSYGPDGSVFIIDWSDSGECHDSTGVHRTSGRVYRVTYGEPKKLEPFDLSNYTLEQLVELHKHTNEWWVRQARRELVARASKRLVQNTSTETVGAFPKFDEKFAVATLEPLVQTLWKKDAPVVDRLRALWTLHAMSPTPLIAPQLFDDPQEQIRCWSIRLARDAHRHDTIFGPGPQPVDPADPDALAGLARQARSEQSALVRLAFASMLQRLPVNQRAELAAALASHAEDADDHNLPAMVWYGLIPVADQKLEALVSIAAETRWPQLRQWIARRLSEDLAKRPNALDKLLAVAAAPEHADLLADVLVGMTDATAGLHKVPRPKSWQAVQTAAEGSTNETVRNQARDLSILFGDGRALDEVRKLALDDKADLQRRRVALEALIQSRPDDLRQICEKLLNVRFLNTTAARGLALFNDPAIGAKLASSYSKFHHSERSAVMETLVSRPIFAAAMLDQMEAGKIARGDLSAFQARQIRSFNDEKLAKRLADVWGEIRDSSADKQKLISGLKESLTTAAIESAQPERGREVFNKVCANCHRLYGHGAEIGPDLTGAGRQNIDYLLGNIIDPSAVVTADFRMSVVLTTDGRVINGIVKAQSPQSITLQTAKERVTLARSDIDTLEVSPLSLMPDNLLQPLTAEQIRDLVAYLMTRSQVPLPADATPSGQ